MVCDCSVAGEDLQLGGHKGQHHFPQHSDAGESCDIIDYLPDVVL